MSDVTLSYKGSDILELSDSGSATLKTGGTYCEADIEVEYVKPSGGGANVDIQTIEVTTASPTADRAFDNFIFIAQCDIDDIPSVANRSAYTAYYVHFVYINGKLVDGSSNKIININTQAAGTSAFNSQITYSNVLYVGNTSIDFSPYWSLANGTQRGTWHILQIEIPSSFPLYSFGDV